MSAENMHIRPATRSDVPVILALIRELAEFEKLDHMMVATEETLADELFGPKSPAETLIGEANGEPVAFAVTFHNFSTFLGKKGLYLEDLYVRRDSRRKGYGKAMLLHVARLAVERDCGRFEWMVLDWNEPAIKFYESMGASILHEWKLARVTGDALERLAAMRLSR
jgi:GNAT superfamily N-acetyltransferase